ncbi:MAG: lysophospholipid acyltransferase family protein [Gemmataceae bacterium]
MTTAPFSPRLDSLWGKAAIASGCCAIFIVTSIRSFEWVSSPWGLSPFALTTASISFAVVAFGIVCAFSLHHVRCLGLFAWTSPIAVASLFPVPFIGPLLLTCSILGLLFALRYAFAIAKSEKQTWNIFRVMPSLASTVLTLALVGNALLLALTSQLIHAPHLPSNASKGWFIGLVIAYTVLTWTWFGRAALEWPLGMVFETMYAIRSRGPGLNQFPRVGPSIVIANHAGYFDPVILEAVLPRPVTAMMTSVYFDLWFVKPFAKYIFHIIRVADSSIRREAPELRDAIAALDRGECVLIFPEAWLRRKEEMPLRRFGQGIWQMLRERPHTPVIACWVEGTWGSYFSHRNGPPTKGKPFDFRLPIRVGVSSPITVPPETLADHWETRFFLMNEVSRARAHLGLEPLPLFSKTNNQSDEV